MRRKARRFLLSMVCGITLAFISLTTVTAQGNPLPSSPVEGIPEGYAVPSTVEIYLKSVLKVLSGQILCQAPDHDANHGDIDQGL
jgi:hypothetical protein